MSIWISCHEEKHVNAGVRACRKHNQWSGIGSAQPFPGVVRLCIVIVSQPDVNAIWTGQHGQILKTKKRQQQYFILSICFLLSGNHKINQPCSFNLHIYIQLQCVQNQNNMNTRLISVKMQRTGLSVFIQIMYLKHVNTRRKLGQNVNVM